MLREEIALYTELSGNDGAHTPIGVIGAYLDGYEKGNAEAKEKAVAVIKNLRDKCGNEEMAFALNWAMRLVLEQNMRKLDGVEE